MICCCRSFAQTCSKLQNTLPEVLSRPAGSEKDDLVRLSFNATEVVYSVIPLSAFAHHFCFYWDFLSSMFYDLL